MWTLYEVRSFWIATITTYEPITWWTYNRYNTMLWRYDRTTYLSECWVAARQSAMVAIFFLIDLTHHSSLITHHWSLSGASSLILCIAFRSGFQIPSSRLPSLGVSCIVQRRITMNVHFKAPDFKTNMDGICGFKVIVNRRQERTNRIGARWGQGQHKYFNNINASTSTSTGTITTMTETTSQQLRWLLFNLLSASSQRLDTSDVKIMHHASYVIPTHHVPSIVVGESNGWSVPCKRYEYLIMHSLGVCMSWQAPVATYHRCYI